MATTSELVVRIGANSDKYAEELKKVGEKTKNLEKQLNSIAKVSGVAFAAGTAAIAGATVAASKFESKFTDVVTLLDKSSFSTRTLKEGIGDLKKGVLELGQESGESFDSLNTSLFNLISAGVPAEEAIDTLRVTTELAAAGATDTATAVQALTATMTSFGESAGDAQEISEKFFTAQKFGVTTVGELASEFSKVAGTANALGVSFDETLASLSALTADGAKPTNVAATQLKAALTSVINVQKTLGQESEAVQQALSLQNLKQKGLVGTLEDLKKATGGNIPEMQRLLGSSESLSVALSLTGAQSELVKKQMREMADEQARAATFAEALATKQETTGKAVERFNRVMETAAILIGDQFAPLISKAADLMGSFFKAFNENPVLAKTAALLLGVGTALAGIISVAAIAATAFLQISAAVTALGISMKVLVGATGIGLVLVGLGALYAYWDEIWPAMQKTFAEFYNYILPALNMVVNGFIDGFNAIVGAAISFGKAYILVWKGIINAVIGVAKGLGNILVGVFTLDTDKIKEGVKQAGDAVVQGAKDTFEKVKKEMTSDSEPIIANVELAPMDIPEEKKKIEEQSKDLKVEVPVIPKTAGQIDAPDSSAADDAKKAEEDKTKFLTNEQKKRIAENKAALEIMKAQREKASAEEIDLIRRAKQLELAESEASKEKNAQVRASEMELIRAQQAQLLIDQQEFEQRKKEQEAIAAEERIIFKQEFNALTKEEQAMFNEEELESIREHILTKDEIEKTNAEEKLERQIATRNKFLQDEIKHGTTIAKLNKIMGSQTLREAKATADGLVQLTQSKNETLKGIGKAAAVTQIGIDTARGAVAAYTSLAGIPFVGPALGAVAAAALIAFGAEKTAGVLAANTGGMVPRNMGVAGKDSVNALLTPGELVVPEKNFDEVVGAVAAGRSGSSSEGEFTEAESVEASNELDLTITLEPTGDLMDMIEQKIIERRIQGVGLL